MINVEQDPSHPDESVIWFLVRAVRGVNGLPLHELFEEGGEEGGVRNAVRFAHSPCNENSSELHA